MCKTCAGIGKILDLDIERAIDPEKSWNEGILELPAFGVGNYYWKQYTGSGLFDLDKKYRDYTPEERLICAMMYFQADPYQTAPRHKSVLNRES